jgi:small-conductance mechanosensitive channel
MPSPVLTTSPQDKDRLDDMEEQVTTLLPELEERYAALQIELEKERQTVAELDQCDKSELAEYRAAISEQK